VHGIFYRGVAQAGGAQDHDVGRADPSGLERELLEEEQHGAETVIDRRGPHVAQNRFDQRLAAQRLRRDRAV
jgi:hypothetical protein